MLQQNEPKEICEENFCDFNKCFLQTHIAKKNGGERLIQKIDNWILWINVNKYGIPIAIISKICHRIIYALG